MNCSTVPLPLRLLVGHGNRTNNGNNLRDSVQYGGGEETESRKSCPEGDGKQANIHRYRGDCGQVAETVKGRLEACHAAEG